MSKRTPYLEILLTLAVLAFLALVIAGGFDQRGNDVDQMTMNAE
jgi:hypothetical protein